MTLKDKKNTYCFKEVEERNKNFWSEKKIYNWSETESRENTFIVDTPPPTVSGQLHIGHVYSYVQADFIVRYKRMIGKNIFYPIGFDDNGLPTERLVEKIKKISSHKLSRKEFVEICHEVIEKEEDKFKNLFNKIALSVDWRLFYQTISKKSCQISQKFFLELVKKNLAYRKEEPIFWDVIDKTALSQADLEEKPKKSFLNEIIFKESSSGEEFSIATTRPELLSACVAVFYHPDDERYKKLEGKFAITPLFENLVPFLPDGLVSIEKGTGLVMCCSFGDVTDALWWRKHKLPLRSIISEDGTIKHNDYNQYSKNAIEYIKRLEGLKIEAARELILNLLDENNALISKKPIEHMVKCAERSGAPIEILPRAQWFISVLDYKEELLNKSAEISWYPRSMKIRLDNWINSISWDWCISRQRKFGVPVPVWYSKRAGEEGKIILPDNENLPVDPAVDLPLGYLPHEVEADFDVFDTWMTSSITPLLSVCAAEEFFGLDLTSYYQMDLRPQAHEIIRTWAFYTILNSYHNQKQIPWHNIMISGWCLAEDRSKMSKSKGNTILPEQLLEEFGTDVIRYWAASSRLGADTSYSPDVIKNGKRLVSKLWNAFNFIKQHFEKISNQDKKLTDLSLIKSKISHPFDQWFIDNIANLISHATNEMEKYEYALCLKHVEEFFWHNFCDDYLEIVKMRCYNEENEGHFDAIFTLFHSLRIILQLFAPFMPFVTEEIYQHLNIYDENKSIHEGFSWPNLPSEFKKTKNLSCDILIAILSLVRKAKAGKNLSVKAPIDKIHVLGAGQISDLLLADLQNVTNAKQIILIGNEINIKGDVFHHEVNDQQNIKVIISWFED